MLKAKSERHEARRTVMLSIVEAWRAGLSATVFDKLRLTPGKIGLSVFLTFTLALASCSFNPNLQGKGEGYIQGVWQQDTNAVQQKLVTVSNYQIRFDCDSFYMQISNTSKVKTGTDTCVKNGRWSEYVRGTYYHRHDTLLLKGLFCKANYSFKTNTDCFRTGPYEESFKVGKKSDTLIELSGTSSVIPLNLRRIEKTVCTQKSL